MRNYAFTDLVGDEEVFFAEYFNKKPLLRKNSLPGDPGEVLSTRRLDELINLEVVRPPYIRVNLRGAGVPEQGYTRTLTVQGADITDSVIPEKIYDLFRAGATVVWSSLNQIDPALRAFTQILSEKFGARTDCVAFLTPTGKEGFSPHHDPVDLFIIQTEGTKRWKLWNPPAVRSGQSATFTAEELGDPAIEVLLEAGDVLYLPYNTPHAAAAEDQVSVHLSIMVRPRMWKDLLQQTVDSLTQDPEFNHFPYIGTLHGASAESEFKQKLCSLAARLEAVDAVAEVSRLADLGRHMAGSSAGHTFQSSAAADIMQPDAQLRRTDTAVQFGANENGRTQLTINGNKIAVPEQVAEKLDSLDSGALVSASEMFPGVSMARSTKAAQGLTRLGVLEMTAGRV
jgi:ribosomal protein L16 Arg81 hydroxylase